MNIKDIKKLNKLFLTNFVQRTLKRNNGKNGMAWTNDLELGFRFYVI